MDQDTVSAFSYVAMYVAHYGDNQIGDDEMQALLSAIKLVGAGETDIEAAAADGAGAFMQAEAKGEDHRLFNEQVETIAKGLNDDQRAEAYRSLVQICVADGEMSKAEVELLTRLRRVWDLAT